MTLKALWWPQLIKRNPSFDALESLQTMAQGEHATIKKQAWFVILFDGVNGMCRVGGGAMAVTATAGLGCVRHHACGRPGRGRQ